MEEKKLTDEQIVKSAEYCANHLDCSKQCPLYTTKNICCTTTFSDLIHRLQSENENLKNELRKECEEHEEFTQKAKAEIERLTEDVKLANDLYLERTKVLEDFRKKNTELQSNIKQLEGDFAIQRDKKVEWFKKANDINDLNTKLHNENISLQKQVDELTKNYNDLIKSQDDIFKRTERAKQQAVKDTAKEILTDLKYILKCCYELETKENAYVYYCKKYGIKVKEKKNGQIREIDGKSK